MRNPPWTRDELIIALEFYLDPDHDPIPGKPSQEIAALSDLLNRLWAKMGRVSSDTFRNRSSVYMKLMNFRAIDPTHPGKGLERGNQDERVVWDRYASNRAELQRVSKAIRALVSSDESLSPQEVTASDEEEGEEGQLLTGLHRYWERNTKLVKRKKKKVLEERQALICEACGFDFQTVYGDRGHGFIECHHTKPLSELKIGVTTKLAELALVCSNCHRMIHKQRPWLSVDELRQLIDQSR